MASRCKLFLLLAASALAITLLTMPVVQVAEIEVDGRLFVARPDTKITVSLEYLHSVELGRVVETYEVLGCEIKLTKLVWPGYGAGLPSRPDDLAGSPTTDSEGYMVKSTSLRLGRVLTLSVKYRVAPRLTINGGEAGPGDLVEIRACVGRPVIWLLRQWLGGSLRVVAGG